MPTIVHLWLAVVLTLFLAVQASCLVFVLRSRRAMTAGRPPRRAELLWTCIPVLIVFFLAARSWVAAFGIAGPAAASAVTASDGGRAPSQPDTSP